MENNISTLGLGFIHFHFKQSKNEALAYLTCLTELNKALIQT